MAKDLGDVVGTALGKVAREAVESVSANARGRSNGSFSGAKGLAAGVGVAALAPIAAKGAGKLVKGLGSNGAGALGKAGDKVGGGLKDAVGDKLAGGAKDAVSEKLPGGGGKSKGVEGVGKGRRMPIQQDIDIGVPIKAVYEEWTQFEKWPEFMHRLESVSQEDESHLSFKTKIWGISKEFKAEIVEQRPGERIKWKVTEGVTHTGVVTFHEIGPRLTRVELNIDVQPGSLIEKAARGMRHVKRAVRADLARFKAHVLMEEEESGDKKSSSSSPSRRKSSSSSRSGSSSQKRGSGSSRSRSSSASSKSSGSSSSGSRSSGSRSSGSSRRTSSRSRGSSSSSNGSSGGSSASGRSSSGGRSGGRSSSRRKSGSRSS